jgi:hypothetical protein
MNRKSFAVGIFAALAPLAALACDKSGTEAQQKADKAVAEANKESAQAQNESTTRITNAQVEADKKVAEAERSFASTRENYRHDVQTKIDDIDKKIVDLDAKAKTATGKKKAELDANLPTIHARRDAFVRNFQGISADTALTWDATKSRLDKDWKDLHDLVDKVD